MSSVPTILVSGALGSGKTSLIRHLVGKNQDLRFAAIINDFGEIGIDADLVRESTSQVIEVTNGCFCCTTIAELPLTIDMVLRKYRADYIIIEMSGEADPTPVIRAIRTLRPRIELACNVTLVDVTLDPGVLLVDQVTRNGILAANFLVLNKIDLSNGEERDAWHGLVAKMNAGAPKIETAHGIVDLSAVIADTRDLDGTATAQSPKHDHEHKHEHRSLNSYCLRGTEIRRASLEHFMTQHVQQFVRAKGFVNLDGQVHELQSVRGRWTLQPFAGTMAETETRIVFLSRTLTAEEMRKLCAGLTAPGSKAAVGAEDATPTC